MAFGIRILGYRNLDEAYAFLRDQRDEATIYAGDEGADQTKVCLHLADGRWRNPLPALVDRSPYGENLTDRELGGEIEEFDNELDVIANAFLEGKPLTDETAERIGELGHDAAAAPSPDPEVTKAPTALVGPCKVKTAEKRKTERSWKAHRTVRHHTSNRI